MFLALKSFRRNKRKENQGSRTIPARPHLHKLAEILEISHTTVWEIVQKLAKTIYQPKTLAVRKQRNFIAVDETVIKINGEKRYLWAAIDVFFCLLSGIILLGVILGLMLPWWGN